MKKLLLVLFALAAAGAAGWYLGRHAQPDGAPETGGRKVAYYQSPMHPWIKSDKPGNCTICGMKLTPVYEGEKGLAIEGNVLTLSSNSINVLHVQTELAELRPIERKLPVAGKIEAQETRYKMLSAYVDGRIEKLFVNYVGAEVQAGQPLAVIYSPSLLTAEREYLTVLAQTNLGASPILAAEQQRLADGARLRLKRLGLTEEQIASLPADGATKMTTQIVAPIGGTVVARAAVEGQYVKEGDKLFEIADLSQMWFRFDVYEQDLPSIHLGQTVRVTSPALGNRAFEGPIAFIDPNINDMSRSARVRVELQNPAIEKGEEAANGGRAAVRRLLYNGLYASGEISLKTAPVLSISRSAVLDPGDQPRVYVDKTAGAYEHRAVALGARGERFVEIRDGLSPGERVVTTGNLLLDSQAQINQSASGPSESQTADAVPSAAGLTLADAQKKAAAEFLTLANKLSEALAADNRDAFNQQLDRVQPASGRLKASFEGVPHLAELAAEASKNGELKSAQNLVIARSEFLPFSMAVAEFAEAYRKHGGDLPGKIFKCPMYPQAGKTAYWIQADGPLRNPFFGSEMLDCGQEVK